MRKLSSIFLAIAFILTVIPSAVNASDLLSIQLYSDNALIKFFHSDKKITWALMEVWPKNVLVTRIGPPAFTLSKGIYLTVVAGPNFSVKGKDLFQSFLLDAIPVINKGSFLGVFITEAGINKDGKAIYSFRHNITCKNIGLRWSGSGTFGEKNENLQIGPMAKYQVNKKFSLEGWFAINPHNREKMVELVFNINF